MKLVSYLKEDHAQLAFLVDDRLYDSDRLHPDMPVTMTMFLNYWEDLFPMAHSINRSLVEGNRKFTGVNIEDVYIFAPVPNPTSCRDGYAFRQHVASARRNRRVEMIPEFDQFPIFYFMNHNSIQGQGDIVCMTDQFNKLDFEMEAASGMCKPGKKIKAASAGESRGG